MVDRVLAVITAALHLAFVAYVVLGGFLAWRWRKAIIPHALAVAWGVLVVTFSPACPLTALEDYYRRRSGQAGLTRGFINTYIQGVLYPAQYVELVRSLVALVVAVSWFVGIYLWWRDRRRKYPIGGGISARRRKHPIGGGISGREYPIGGGIGTRRTGAHRVGY
jgi:hypothetical protein